MKKAIILLLCILFTGATIDTSAQAKPKRPKSGNNYKSHAKKNAKYKRNNEAGKYMKCGRK
jgi:hypothetical protein